MADEQKAKQRLEIAHVLLMDIVGYSALLTDEQSEALDWLEESYRERDGDSIGVIRVDPRLVLLHSDPRSEALAEKIVPAAEFGDKTSAKK